MTRGCGNNTGFQFYEWMRGESKHLTVAEEEVTALSAFFLPLYYEENQTLTKELLPFRGKQCVRNHRVLCDHTL